MFNLIIMKKSEKTKSQKAKSLSRRNFISTLGAASAALTIIPRHTLGGIGYTAPSDMLNIAGIGVGGRGSSDIYAICPPEVDERRVLKITYDDAAAEANTTRPYYEEDDEPRKPEKLANIYALCDVDEERAFRTFKGYPKAKIYKDFRQMLEKEKSIDAVVIATPDHTHAVAAMMAMKMGKHVYCEKPLTHTVYEARAMAKVAKEAGVATQMGNQGMAADANRQLKEWLWAGAIGDVREVHAWSNRPIWPQGINRPLDTPRVPSTLDWDLWLGPSPERSYNPAYVPFAWRGWFDFGSGAIGDEAIHNLAPVFSSLKLTAPTLIQGSSSPVFPETYPLASVIHFEFPAREKMPPVTIHWYDGGILPARLKELDAEAVNGVYSKDLPDWDTENGVIFVGDKGKLLSRGEGTRYLRFIPNSRLKDFKAPKPYLPRSIGHHKEWIEACKGNGTTQSNFGFAGPLTEACQLGNICIRMGGAEIKWDSENLKITNYEDANKLLQIEYRKGWSL
jgi:predicted dehydrogenase